MWQHSQEATIIHTTGATYKVTLANMRFSDGCKYCTSHDVCSHIVWVMLYVYKVPEENELLDQHALLNGELERMQPQVFVVLYSGFTLEFSVQACAVRSKHM